MFPSVGLSLKTSDFDDAPGEREAIECLTVGETQLARWRPMAWTVGCLIAFDDEIACDFFRAFDKVVERKPWNPKMEVWKMSFLFKQVFSGSMLNFQGVYGSKQIPVPKNFLESDIGLIDLWHSRFFQRRIYCSQF